MKSSGLCSCEAVLGVRLNLMIAYLTFLRGLFARLTHFLCVLVARQRVHKDGRSRCPSSSNKGTDADGGLRGSSSDCLRGERIRAAMDTTVWIREIDRTIAENHKDHAPSFRLGD